jgi:transposase-like protein
MPQGVVTSEDTKTKAVEELRMRKVSGVSAKGIGKKYGVNDSSVYNWMRAAEGKPYKRKGEEKKPEGARTRVAYSDDFKAKVVEDYIQRSPGTFATDIAKKHGIDRQRLEKWVGASRAGKLRTAAEPDRSEATQLARAPKANGHTQVSAQLHLSMSDAPPPVQNGALAHLPLHLQLYVQRLEAQNKALRKMLQIAMEAI